MVEEFFFCAGKVKFRMDEPHCGTLLHACACSTRNARGALFLGGAGGLIHDTGLCPGTTKLFKRAK